MQTLGVMFLAKQGQSQICPLSLSHFKARSLSINFVQHSIHLMPTAMEKGAVTLCCNALAVALNITSYNFPKEGAVIHWSYSMFKSIIPSQMHTTFVILSIVCLFSLTNK